MSWWFIGILTIIIISLIAIIVWLWLKIKKHPIASFTISPSAPAVGELVTFTNTSVNAKSYVWEINGVKITTVNTTQIFKVPGLQNIGLLATNGDITSILSTRIKVS